MEVISVPYKPRDVFKKFHQRSKRWAVLVAHRRCGKTVSCVNDLIRAAICFPKMDNGGRFAYIAPQYAQAKDIAWNYVKQYTGAIPGVSYNESELRVDFAHNGARIRLYGTENEARLRGLYLDGCILDEYANISPSVFDLIIRPMLSDRKGWAVFIGTPAGHNAFYRKWQEALLDPENYYTAMLKASDTHIIDEDELEALKREMTDDAFEQEYQCSFEAAIRGAIFGKEMKALEDKGSITNVPYDPGSEVWVSWDLGIGKGGHTSLWFAQQVGREVRVIDFYTNFGMGLDHYVKLIREKPYLYGKHILPHDAESSEISSGASSIEVLRSLGIRNYKILRKTAVEDGINKARLFLPKCVFDRKNCERGVEALKLYRYNYDEKADVMSRKPLHDWTSNPADSFRYLAVGFTPEMGSSTQIVYPNLAIP